MNVLSICQKYYSGFALNEPVGNNAFSFEQRSDKQVFVPSIISGTVNDLEVGQEFAFIEVVDGSQVVARGLKNFIYWQFQEKHFFIFDNHNHAFFFWMMGYRCQLFPKGLPLVHIDQHRDTREPESFLDSPLDKITPQAVFEYTNRILNVGNFIPPALKLGLFNSVEIVNSQESFEKDLPSEFILDLDIDILADEMAYLDQDFVRSKIVESIKAANFITIATSPFFIPPKKAIEQIQLIFSDLTD
jgi:hypothetical protein